MNEPFKFDFDKAEKEIKKEKEKLQKSDTTSWVDFWTRFVEVSEINLKFTVQNRKFGEVYIENENFRVKQGCNFCKNNIQSKINTCRKCKFHDRKNRQSNFVPDPNQKIQSRFKLNKIWNSVFSELDA